MHACTELGRPLQQLAAKPDKTREYTQVYLVLVLAVLNRLALLACVGVLAIIVCQLRAVLVLVEDLTPTTRLLVLILLLLFFSRLFLSATIAALSRICIYFACNFAASVCRQISLWVQLLFLCVMNRSTGVRLMRWSCAHAQESI
jgi:hypothetical protein